MKILVTGGSGFIGSNFIHFQMNKGNKIFNLDKLTYASNSDSLLKYKKDKNYSFKKGDIASSKDVSEVINTFRPDVIVNFAAESHVDRSIDGPSTFIKTNILGTFVLLEESLKYYNTLLDSEKDRFKFIHISTDEVFGSLGNDGFFEENTPYDPSSPYSASKASSDHLVIAWNRTFKLPVLITNCSNNYGPYQFPEKLIPLMIINALQCKKLPIYGTGENIRDWLYVEDHCRAIDVVMKKGRLGESYLIGGNNEISNLNIVRIICKKLNELVPRNDLDYIDLIEFVNDRPGHDFRYAINYSKIKNELNWEPEVSFDIGITKTIEWYLDNVAWLEKIQKNIYDQKRIGVITK